MVSDVGCIEYEGSVEVGAYGVSISQKNGVNNTYLGSLIDAILDVRLNEDFGVYTNIVADKRCIYDRLSEVNAAYLYYVFDIAGELHIGHDKPIDNYIKVIEPDWFDNRTISSYFNGAGFSRYSISDDHSAMRVMWLSPEYKGWKLAAGYVPNSSVCRGKSNYYTRDLVNIGLSYSGAVNEDCKYGFAILSHFGRSYDDGYHGVKSFSIEGNLSYRQFSVNGRLVNDLSSLHKILSKKHDTCGEVNFVYKMGQFSLNCGYFWSHRQLSDGQNSFSKSYSIGGKYVYKEYEIFGKYRKIFTAGNDGQIFMVGVKLPKFEF